MKKYFIGFTLFSILSTSYSCNNISQIDVKDNKIKQTSIPDSKQFDLNLNQDTVIYSIKLSFPKGNNGISVIGEKLGLNYIVNTSKGFELDSKNIDWESSNPKIAIVDNGIITGVSEGKVIIKAIAKNDKSKSGVLEILVVK